MRHNKYNKTEDIIKKRILTTMIGALSRFEDTFGYLWGIDSDNPTISQLDIEAKWEKVRTEILDHGNNQIRSAINDVRSKEPVDKIKYSYYYKLNTRRNNNED